MFAKHHTIGYGLSTSNQNLLPTTAFLAVGLMMIFWMFYLCLFVSWCAAVAYESSMLAVVCPLHLMYESSDAWVTQSSYCGFVSCVNWIFWLFHHPFKLFHHFFGEKRESENVTHPPVVARHHLKHGRAGGRWALPSLRAHTRAHDRQAAAAETP